MSSSIYFEKELGIFESEVRLGISSFYTYLSFNSGLAKNKRALSKINQTPYFWITITRSLHACFFITLRRIFDQKSKHNIDVLMKFAQSNIEIFSKESIRRRKEKHLSGNALEHYVQGSHEPQARDFRQLRKKISEQRKIFVKNYRDIGHRIFAHNEVSGDEAQFELYKKTNVRELEKLFVFLYQLHEALWMLYYNGRKPVLRRMKTSHNNIMRKRMQENSGGTEQELAVHDVKTFISLLQTVRD